MERRIKKSPRGVLHPAAWGSFGLAAFQALEIFNTKKHAKAASWIGSGSGRIQAKSFLLAVSAVIDFLSSVLASNFFALQFHF